MPDLGYDRDPLTLILALSLTVTLTMSLTMTLTLNTTAYDRDLDHDIGLVIDCDLDDVLDDDLDLEDDGLTGSLSMNSVMHNTRAMPSMAIYSESHSNRYTSGDSDVIFVPYLCRLISAAIP